MPLKKPSVAALSGPLLALFLGSFFLNAGSGIALWIWPTHDWRVLHGCSNPIFLITLGVIWRFHVVRAWKLRKNVLSGSMLLMVFLVLTATGWTIYYSGSDEIQKWAAKSHTWMGLAVCGLLLLHSLLGLRSRD